MIFVGPHVFETFETPQKIIKLRCIHDGEMGPYHSVPRLKKIVLSPAIFAAYRDTVQETLQYITKRIFNDRYYMEPKILEALESLAKQYEFKDLTGWFERYWQNMKDISYTNNLPLEVKNRPNTVHENDRLIRQFKDEMKDEDIYPELKQANIRYLEEKKANLGSYLSQLNNTLQGMKDRDYEEWIIDIWKELSKYSFYEGKVKSIGITIAHLLGKYDSKKTVVTDDMIMMAKKVPFNKLLKLDSFGRMERCKCPFHNEKTASFYVYPDTNRGHCHGCGKNVDTIQYMIEIKKLSFNQAVLCLLDY